MTCEAFGVVAKIAFAKFNSSDKNTFVLELRSILSFEGMWASRPKSLADRMVDKKLGKIKRAIIEIIECETAAVVIDRVEQIVYQFEVNSSALTEIVKIAADGVVVLVGGVSEVVGERFCSFIVEATIE